MLDAAVVAAYGLILPEPILAAPRLWLPQRPCLAAAALARRGADPARDPRRRRDDRRHHHADGEGLDTGPMLAVLPAEIGRKTAGELTAELAALGARLMVAGAGLLRPGRPDAAARGARHLRGQDREAGGEARFRRGRPREVERQVRAFNPAPGAFFEYEGERIKVLAAEISELSGAPGTVLDHGLAIACGEGSIVPTSGPARRARRR